MEQFSVARICSRKALLFHYRNGTPFQIGIGLNGSGHGADVAIRIVELDIISSKEFEDIVYLRAIILEIKSRKNPLRRFDLDNDEIVVRYNLATNQGIAWFEKTRRPRRAKMAAMIIDKAVFDVDQFLRLYRVSG